MCLYFWNLAMITTCLPSCTACPLASAHNWALRLCAGGCYLQVHARLLAGEESDCQDDCGWLKTPAVGTAMFFDIAVCLDSPTICSFRRLVCCCLVSC
jgi:hypothetical protein